MELLSLMNGDVSSLASVLGDVNYLEIIQQVLGAYMEESPYGPMMKQYLNMFLQSDQGKMVTDGAKTFMANVAVSESGQRLLKLAPQIMAVKDFASLTQILDQEVVYNWNLFFDQFVNSNDKDEIVMTMAEMIVKVKQVKQGMTSDCIDYYFLGIQLCAESSSEQSHQPTANDCQWCSPIVQATK